MKVKKLTEYAPEYPARKRAALKIGALAAAAVLAASTAAGCGVTVSGYLENDPPAVTDAPITPEPTEELCVPGEPAVDENGNIIPEGTEEPSLLGDVQIDPSLGVGD